MEITHEELQEMIRVTITEMLAEIPPKEPEQPEQPETPEEQTRPENQISEIEELRSQIKQLTAAIHHSNFLNAGMQQPPAPEKTVGDVFRELINPPRKGE